MFVLQINVRMDTFGTVLFSNPPRTKKLELVFDRSGWASAVVWLSGSSTAPEDSSRRQYPLNIHMV